MTSPGELKVHVFSEKRNTVQLSSQHYHQAHSQEHGLKAECSTQKHETSKDTNHFPDSSCATTPFYRKVNRRHVSTSIDSWLIYSQEETPMSVAGTPQRMALNLML